jgi:hypothetical protein
VIEEQHEKIKSAHCARASVVGNPAQAKINSEPTFGRDGFVIPFVPTLA